MTPNLPRGWHVEETRTPTGIAYTFTIRLAYEPSVRDRIVIAARRPWRWLRRSVRP